MRLPAVAVAIALLFAVGIGSAQIIGVTEWGQQHPEQHPTASWYGSTGLIVTPSALIGAPMRATGGYHRVETEDDDETVYNANIALMQDLEVGVTRLKDIMVPGILGDTLSSKTVMNAKLNLDFASWLRVVGGPEIAVGVWDASDKVNRAIYVVASKSLSIKEEGTLSKFTIHVGFGDTEQNIGPLDGVFGGLDLVLFEGALLQLEYDAENFNAALRYYPAPQLSLDVGVLDGELGFGASFQTTY